MAGIDAFTTLMLHCDGADASTTFTDSSLSPKTVTPNGDAQIDTAQSKFGGASGLFDGTGDYLLNDGSSDFAFGTGDFTIDLWVRFASVATTMAICDFRSAILTTSTMDLFFATPAHAMALSVNGSNIILGTTVLVADTWYHIAVARSSGVTKMFINGAVEASVSNSTNYLVGANRPAIGVSGVTLSTIPFNGWIDELRISKGIARWTAAFTPPTSAYNSAVDYSLSVAPASYAVTMQAATLTAAMAEQRIPRAALFRRSSRSQWRGAS